MIKDRHCNGCPFYTNKFVGPAGPTNARIVLIGEAPGEQEEKEGKPFVGGAGRTLDKFLVSAGLDRDTDIYITNVLKCRPPRNNILLKASQEALKHCTKKFEEEIKFLKPVVWVPTGNTALHALGMYYKIGSVRGSVLKHSTGKKIIPTYHPAWIMRGNWAETYSSIRDWMKIKRHSLLNVSKEIPEYFFLDPTIQDVEHTVAEIARRARTERVTIAMDMEAFKTGSPFTSPIKLVGIATSERSALVIPFITQSGNYYWKTHGEELRAIQAIAQVLENPDITILFQHALYDVPLLMNHGFAVQAKVYDTLVGHYLIYHPSKHDLGYLVSIYSDYEPWKLAPQGGDEDFRKYNARDCIVLHVLKPGLDEDMMTNGITAVFNRQMRNILPAARMMLNGVHVDRDALRGVSKRLQQELGVMRASLEDLSGVPGLNPNSNPQLQEVLFKKMKLRSAIRTKSKKGLSTGEDVLKRLSVRYPTNTFVSTLLDYRTLQKLDSTYNNPPILDDGRVHSQFKMTVLTGRFASEGPNMQNLPSGKSGDKGDRQKYVRQLYTAEPGNVFVSFDLKQAEIVAYAIIANDAVWLEGIATGKDIHELNCVSLLGYYDPRYRTFIKNFIFGIIYGSAGQEIKKVMPKELMGKVSVDDLMKRLWAAHPSLLAFRKVQEIAINKRKRVIDPFGRTRYFPGSISTAEIRQGINFPIQATIGSVMHEKMALLDEALNWPEEKIVLQLHDALYVEVPERSTNRIGALGKHIMELPTNSPAGHTFKFNCEVEIGVNLGQMKKL